MKYELLKLAQQTDNAKDCCQSFGVISCDSEARTTQRFSREEPSIALVPAQETSCQRANLILNIKVAHFFDRRVTELVSPVSTF